jgi:hypothetical protein
MVNIMSIETLDLNEVVDSFEDTAVSELITTDSDDGVVVELGSPVVVLDTPVVDVPVKEKKVKPEPVEKVHVKTKADYAREIFAAKFGQEGIARKDIIKAFQDPANFGGLEPLTPAGAGTYYQQLTKKPAVQ